MARTLIKRAGAPDTIADQSVGSVGAEDNAQGPLVDGDITFANSAYYPLSGDALQVAGNGPALNDAGTPRFDAKGFFGREDILRTNGIDSGLRDTTDDAFFDITGTDNLTLGGWFKLDNPQGLPLTQSLIAKWEPTGSQRQYGLFLTGGTSEIGFSVSNNGSTIVSAIGDGVLTDGWHHLVGVHEGGTEIRFYLDGQLVSTTAHTTGLFAGTGVFRIMNGGSVSGGDSFTSGTAQDVFITTDLLTEAQINSLYSKRYDLSSQGQLAGGHSLDGDSFPRTDLSGNTYFWNLNEASGDALDGSSNNKTLTALGSIPRNGLDIYGNNTAAVFDGGGSSEFNSSDAALRFSTSMTIAGWFAIDETLGANSHAFFARYDNAGDEESFLLRYTATGLLEMQSAPASDGDANEIFSASVDIIRGQWNHYAYIFDNGLAKLYFNGVLVAEHTFTFTEMFAGTTPFKLGARLSGTDNLVGRAQYCMASSDVYSDEDIRKLASSRIDLTTATNPEDQHWEATTKREDGQVEAQVATGWLVDKRSDKVYVDFGGASGDSVSLKLRRDK